MSRSVAFGVALPHRSVKPIPRDLVECTARQAEQLGFDSLWVTENTLNTDKPHVKCLDPVVALSFAAAVTRRVKLGLAVAVLNTHDPFHLAHQWATLDHLSEGRAVLGVGLGRPFNYEEFGVPMRGRARRFEEYIELVRALWTGQAVEFCGEFVTSSGSRIAHTPARPRIPLLIGGTHPTAIERAVRLGDGWIAPGAAPKADFGVQVDILRRSAERLGRGLADFPVVKRVHVAVDDGSGRARRQLVDWFQHVYRNPSGHLSAGIVGSSEQVAEEISRLVAAGATHLLLCPVDDFSEQLPALAETLRLVATA